MKNLQHAFGNEKQAKTFSMLKDVGMIMVKGSSSVHRPSSDNGIKSNMKAKTGDEHATIITYVYNISPHLFVMCYT